jgi:hypothetical protein
MIKIFIFLILILLYNNKRTEETIYLIAYDPISKSIGQAYSSSGFKIILLKKKRW